MVDGEEGASTSCNGSTSNSQLKLSKKPNRSVVSDWEKRSAEEGIGMGGGGGNKSEVEESKVNSKSAKGTGGELSMVVAVREIAGGCSHTSRLPTSELCPYLSLSPVPPLQPRPTHHVRRNE